MILLLKSQQPVFYYIKINNLVYIYMTKTFTILLQHDEDALMLEALMNEHKIFYEYDVIGSDELIYEFEINNKYKKIINILLEYNSITILKFISN